MADPMTLTAVECVQCPVCFKNFGPAEINGHLDECLLIVGAVDSDQSPSVDSGPPEKKQRFRRNGDAEAPRSPCVNNTTGPTMFSLFNNNKNKSPLNNGSLSNKQAAAAAAATATKVSKGIKRGVDQLDEAAEPGPSGEETVKNPTAVSVGQRPGLSLRSLLTLDKPLAEMLRPNSLDEYFGQSKVIGEQTLIRSLLDTQDIPSLILWGPPGCGKVRQQHR